MNTSQEDVPTVHKHIPHFEHDCEMCVFLGSLNGEDLYFHPFPNVTLVRRQGNEGWDYTSGLMLWSVDPIIGEAAKRAITLGLLTQEYLDKHRAIGIRDCDEDC